MNVKQGMEHKTEPHIGVDSTPTGNYGCFAYISDSGELLLRFVEIGTDNPNVVMVRFDRYETQKIRTVLKHKE